MALRFVTPEEALNVERATVALYGAPGVGKSSLALTAENALLMDFDGGAHRALRRGDVARVESWRDVVKLSGETAERVKSYDTLIVDTVGTALDMLADDIIRREPNMGNRMGGLTLQGFGALRSTFARWLHALTGAGKDVVLVSHATEAQEGGQLVQRLAIQGSTKDAVHQAADMFGYVSVDDEGGRYVDFRPAPGHHGKDPAGFGRVRLPRDREDTLGAMIAEAKRRLSSPPATHADKEEDE